MTAAEDREARVLFPVYSALVTYLRPETDVLTTSPGDLVGLIAWHGAMQTACLIVAHCPHITCALEDAADLVDEVRSLCEAGRRPRYLAEIRELHDTTGGWDGC
jgi:hypothetical protein